MDVRWTYMVNWLTDRTHRLPFIIYRKGVTHKKLTNPVK